jgi:hypothetical protein
MQQKKKLRKHRVERNGNTERMYHPHGITGRQIITAWKHWKASKLNILFFQKNELLPCRLMHLGYGVVIPSMFWARQSMDKFNSMPSNKFSAFQATDACRNFQTTSSKPSFNFRFITIMNVFLEIILV